MFLESLFVIFSMNQHYEDYYCQCIYTCIHVHIIIILILHINKEEKTLKVNPLALHPLIFHHIQNHLKELGNSYQHPHP